MKCMASLVVTTHRTGIGRNTSYQTNQFSVKKSMHEPSCSLSKEPGKVVAIKKLPPIGKKVTVLNGAFSAKRI